MSQSLVHNSKSYVKCCLFCISYIKLVKNDIETIKELNALIINIIIVVFFFFVFFQFDTRGQILLFIHKCPFKPKLDNESYDSLINAT